MKTQFTTVSFDRTESAIRSEPESQPRTARSRSRNVTRFAIAPTVMSLLSLASLLLSAPRRVRRKAATVTKSPRMPRSPWCPWQSTFPQPTRRRLGADPSQPLEAREKDLIGRMTLAEKVAQLQNGAPAIRRLGLPAYDYWSEALHGVANTGNATVFPQAIGMAATWDPALIGQEASVIGIEGRAKFNDYASQHNGDAQMVRRPDVLVAEHQHLPRSALGTRPGNLRRGPVSHGLHGRRLHPRIAGRRSALHDGDGLRQAFRRPQRPGTGTAPLRRRAAGARFI